MARSASSSLVTKVAALGFPLDTPSPFLFAVFHMDMYPTGSARNMEAPRTGDGADFNAAQPYRMYHGERIPGFPQHPRACMVIGDNTSPLSSGPTPYS